MGPDEVVRIRNIHPTRDFSDGYSGQVYTIPPGSEEFVPFAAMCLWLGHPEAVDMGPGKEYRMEEHQRLNVRYGVFEDPDITKDEMWANNIPQVEVFDLHGNSIVTVLHDPLGKNITPIQETANERELLLGRMEQMQADMRAMQARLDAQERARVASENSGPIPTDGPAGVVDPTVPTAVPSAAQQIVVNPPVGSDARLHPAAPVDEVSEDAPTRVKVGPRN